MMINANHDVMRVAAMSIASHRLHNSQDCLIGSRKFSCLGIDTSYVRHCCQSHQGSIHTTLDVYVPPFVSVDL